MNSGWSACYLIILQLKYKEALVIILKDGLLKMKFSIPYNGDRRIVDVITSPRFRGSINDVYFGGNPTIIPSGRRPKIKHFIKYESEAFYFDSDAFDKDVERLIYDSNSNGISCNLLLNFEGLLSKKQLDYVNFLIEMGLKIITVGNLKMLKQLRKQLIKNVEIQSSVYIKIDGLNTIAELLSQGVRLIVLPPDRNHDLGFISQLVNRFKNKGIVFKLLVNEGCLKNCQHRISDLLSAQSYPIDSAIKDYIENTNEIRPLNHHCRLEMNTYGIAESNFIHPSELKKYLKYDLVFKLDACARSIYLQE